MRNEEEKSSWVKKAGIVILIVGAIAWTVVSCTAEV